MADRIVQVVLTHNEVREAVREYVAKRGFKLAVPKTVNQNTGLKFQWNNNRKDALTVTVNVKD